ncbi:helix-turn-helix domain-containing protein [Streptomyces kanamyceticus]|uniref:helix-turn-helix domain-containing protein n=1 Tax=Streptomyces kanamyceticus TaxID=1967 RepID=UPI0006E25FAE|nr:helix-turn-helix transcriptional regulator [Streptomyces kanamyceticus]
MAPRSAPSARRQRIGVELRRLRERAGMTAAEASRALGTTQGQISNIEANRFGVNPERVRTLARIYGCTDTQLVDALADMAAERTRGWWEEYREILPQRLLDLAELEHHADALRVAQALHIPGLLQTAQHARALFADAVPPRLPHEIEHLMSYRIKRQAVLHRGTPLPYTALIHEAALHMRVGGPAVAAEQLNHLVEMGRRAHISVLVIPFGRGAFPGSGQGIDYAHGPVTHLDTVQLDTEHGSEFLDAAAQLERYTTVLDRLEKLALPAEESRELIAQAAATQK